VDNNLAVLIDFENIAAGTEKDRLGRFDVELVLARLSDKGRILISRSYADWGRFARFKQGLLTNNVSMMELTSHGMHDKNRADIAMVVEGMELAFTKPYVDTFVIVSGDSDFTPMVLKMRELDKRVIGVGCRSSTSRLLIQACDEFIFYDSLVERRSRKQHERPAPGEGTKLQGAFELLLDAVEGLLRENPDPPLAGMVKTAILRKTPDFSENELGFSTFARFLEKARKEGIISVSRDEKSGGYRVEPPQSGTTSEEKASDKGGRSKAKAAPSDDDGWMDPYLPKDTGPWIEILAAENLNPLAAPTRKAILQALEEVATERNQRKKRVTVQFVQEDVKRALRRTHPDLPMRAIRNVFNGLLRAGVFIHRDGSPVRTGSAPFTLQKSAEQLNETLADIYIDELHRAGAYLDVPRLAELFFGDASHTRPVEESIAYLQATNDEDDEGRGTLDLDLDTDLLLLEDDDGEEAKPAAKASKPRGRAKKTEPSVDAALSSEDDANAVDVQADAESEVPKKKAPRRKAVPKAAEAKTEATPEPVVEASEADDTEKKTTRRRRPRKKVDEGSEDLDGLLSED
jgi:hypothetical protein